MKVTVKRPPGREWLQLLYKVAARLRERTYCLREYYEDCHTLFPELGLYLVV